MLPVSRGPKLGGRAYGTDGRALRRSTRRRLCTLAWALGALVLPSAAVVFILHGTPLLARGLAESSRTGLAGTEAPDSRRLVGTGEPTAGVQGTVGEPPAPAREDCAIAVESWLEEEAARKATREKMTPLDLTFFLHVPRTAGRHVGCTCTYYTNFFIFIF